MFNKIYDHIIINWRKNWIKKNSISLSCYYYYYFWEEEKKRYIIVYENLIFELNWTLLEFRSKFERLITTKRWLYTYIAIEISSSIFESCPFYEYSVGSFIWRIFLFFFDKTFSISFFKCMFAFLSTNS